MRIVFMLLGATIGLTHFAISAAGAEANSHGRSPYADYGDRAIKSMSNDRVEDLKAGRGASLALAAELNGYPGPAHVLELAQELELSPEQIRHTEQLRDRMRSEAVQAGLAIIAQESALNTLFRENRATTSLMGQATDEIGRAEGKLRAVHLAYHIEMIGILTPHQVVRYQSLRGYSGDSDRSKHH